MKSPRTLLYAVILRLGVLGAYFYLYRTIPSLTSGIIGLILGLAGGVYIDVSRQERDVADNLAFGLILSAILRLADIYYGITALTPQSYKMALIAVSAVAMISALSSEVAKGTTGRIPVLGLLAVLIAFMLVFSAVSTVTIEKTTRANMAPAAGSRKDGLNYSRHFESSTGAYITATYNPINATGSISRTLTAYTRTDSSGVSHTSDRIIYVGILIRTKDSNFTRSAGTYQFELAFSANVTKPDVKLFGRLSGTRQYEKSILDNSIDEYYVSITINVTLSASDATLLNRMDRVLIEVSRYDNGASLYPALPFSITISRSQVEQERVNTTYILAAIGAMIIAVIDALPLDTKKVARRRRKKRKRR